MKSANTKKFCVLLVVVLSGVLLGALIYPKKYKKGMSWDQVVAIANPEKLKLYGTGLETEGLSAQRLEQEVVYTIYDSNAGLYVELNYYKRVIRVQRWKYFGVDFAKLINKIRGD